MVSHFRWHLITGLYCLTYGNFLHFIQTFLIFCFYFVHQALLISFKECTELWNTEVKRCWHTTFKEKTTNEHKVSLSELSHSIVPFRILSPPGVSVSRCISFPGFSGLTTGSFLGIVVSFFKQLFNHRNQSLSSLFNSTTQARLSKFPRAPWGMWWKGGGGEVQHDENSL